MDPKENLEKTIGELTTEEVVTETPSTETVIAAATEVVAPVVSEPAKNDVMFSDKPKKKGAGMVLGMILLAIIAAGGVGFGVWAMMDKNTEVDRLNKQITELKNQNVNYDEEVIVDVDTGEDVDTADYIYVGEWGVKIEIPGSLSTVSYRFSHEAGYTKVTVWGVDCSEGKCQYFPEYADANKNVGGMGSIARYPKGQTFEGGSAPVLVFSDDLYDYYFYPIQMAYTADNPSDVASWERESVEIISDMLSDSNSYSKF